MKSKRILSVFLIVLSVLTLFTVTASALTWDGSSAGGSTRAVNGSSTGYVIRSTSDDYCVVGYRFSVVNNAGDLKVNKVIDVYRNSTNGDNAYSSSAKFSTKYNKKQLIANKNKTLTTTYNTTNCYKEKDMGFVSKLPNPSGVETWQKYETNINKVLTKLGVGTVSNMIYGDKVIVEPLFDVCLAGEYQALTVTEIAYCGRAVKGGSSDGGVSNGTSSTWGFISNYTNRIWPNKLYTPNGQGLWTAATALSSKISFDNIMTKGYGAGIAYSETTKINYTIAFNGNGATSGSTTSMSMTYGTAKNLTANGFKRTGYTFTGWNTKADGTGTKYSNKQSVNNLTTTNGATITMYAQWRPNVLTIVYDCYGSSVSIDTSKGYALGAYNRLTSTKYLNKAVAGTNNVYYHTVNYNNAIGGNGLHDFATFGLTAPAGYRFTGWKCGSKIFDETTTTYKPTDFTDDIKNGDTYVWMSAQFSKITYTVTYNANGGSGAPGNQTKTYGVDLTLSSTKPTRTGYTFNSWNTNSSGTGTNYASGGKYTGNANLTLYAKWKPITYTVSYNANGGSGAPGNQTKTHGVDLTLSSTKPTRTGYTFNGWNTNSSGMGTNYASGGKYTGNANLTLYAKWKPVTYTVSYNANGGSGAPGNQTKTHGVDLTLSSTKPTRTGYTFNGWNTNSSGTGTNYASGGKYTGNANLTLYAKWKPITYTVSYNANGGSGTPGNQTKTHGVDLTLSSTKPTRTGYTFNGWNTNSSGTGTNYASGGKYTGNANLTLYAKWTPITYQVKFNGNGATSGSMSNQAHTYDKSQTLTANAYKREFTVTYNYNYSGKGNSSAKATAVFGGWATTTTGTKAYNDKQSVNNLSSKQGDVVNLYAKWTDASVTLPTPTRTGYVFNGWYTSAAGGTKVGGGGASYKPTTNITVYAHWTPITYTIRFNANGGTGTMADLAMTYDTAKNLTANTFTKSGAEFVKWNTKAEGTGTAYTDKQSVKNLTTVNGTVINLYAQWKNNRALSLESITPNAAYREGTDVVTSFNLVNKGSGNCTPADKVNVVFKVYRDSTVIKTVTLNNVIVPGNEKNLLYFKWNVPSDLGSAKISISGEIVENGASYGLVKNSYTTCKYDVYSTPDTQYEISAPDGFTVLSLPTAKTDTAKWSVWTYDGGAFKKVNYGVSISDDSAVITPDKSANAEKKNGGWVMKSGYGYGISINNAVKNLSGMTAAPTDAYTTSQYALALFPEFGYKTTAEKCRTLELVSGKWVFRQNDDYGRLHFTPLWFPDGNYTASVKLSDCWTPAGMIAKTANTNTITISGSAYDDWYLG